MYVLRVATGDNIADTPSRKVSHMCARSTWPTDPSRCAMCKAEVPALMRHIGATFVTPRLSDGSLEVTNWAVLKERWLMDRVV